MTHSVDRGSAGRETKPIDLRCVTLRQIAKSRNCTSHARSRETNARLEKSHAAATGERERNNNSTDIIASSRRPKTNQLCLRTSDNPMQRSPSLYHHYTTYLSMAMAIKVKTLAAIVHGPMNKVNLQYAWPNGQSLYSI
jgi:hypothetical protein